MLAFSRIMQNMHNQSHYNCIAKIDCSYLFFELFTGNLKTFYWQVCTVLAFVNPQLHPKINVQPLPSGPNLMSQSLKKKQTYPTTSMSLLQDFTATFIVITS